MIKDKKYILYFFLLLSLPVLSQDESNPFRIWRLTSFSGRAMVREQLMRYGTSPNYNTSSYLNGIISANTKSFFIHPNLMELSVNGTYNPSTNRTHYIDIPSFPEKTQSQGVDASAFFFKKKNININTIGSFYNTYSNIENITKVRAKSRVLGANLRYSNKILPFGLAYSNSKTDETVIGSNRSIKSKFQAFEANAEKSITQYDNSTLFYTHNISSSAQYDNGIASYQSGNSFGDYLSFGNQLTFEKQKKVILTSGVSTSRAQGGLNYNSLNGNEGLLIKLPKRFVLNNGYYWGIVNQGSTKINTEGYQSTLSHRLFESLNSSIFFRKSYSGQSVYKQQTTAYGLDLRYSKNIPKGLLTLAYNYTKTIQTVRTPPVSLHIYREPYVLDSTKIILLTNANVDINSVVVKDVTGTIIYTLGLDYDLIDHFPYLEIQHIVGSPILHNGNTVYIDYTCTKAGYYKYSGTTNFISASASLFKNFITPYYNVGWQGFGDITNGENVVLNTYVRHVAGIRANYKFINGGIEYEHVTSNLLPYQGMKYDVSFYKIYKNVYFGLNGNLQDMEIGSENARRQSYSTSLNVAYTLFRRVNLRLNNMYTNWNTRGNNIKLVVTTFDVSASFHKFSAAVGTQYYWNKTGTYTTNFKGVYIQLSRTF